MVMVFVVVVVDLIVGLLLWFDCSCDRLQLCLSSCGGVAFP